MTRETTRTINILSLAAFMASAAVAGCGANTGTGNSVDVAGGAAPLYDSDKDGHNDYDDSWRFKKHGDHGSRRNICPVVQAFAQPNTITVGQSTKLFGYAADFDGPRRLQYTWTVDPATIGTVANSSSKRTSFKCLQSGVAHLEFSAYDGDCRRGVKVNVYCKPTTEPKCGDGHVDPNETCDGNCPTSCDDHNACTTDTLSGSAAQCNAKCTNAPITMCKGGDGCCPSGCTKLNDSDCSAPVCGDGHVDPGETCDGNCPTSCDDGNSCTTDVKTGSATTCNVKCTHSPVTACAAGDMCCPNGCSSSNDSDCMPAGPTCGNGVVETGETCDPVASCPTSCDDHNVCTTDALSGSAANCTAKCTNTPITACVNGDGCCAPGCTNANDNDCQPTARCGDGNVDPGETCDGNCPTSCDDHVACTTDVMTGSAAQCNVMCTHSAITVCDPNNVDKCCADGCNANTDIDCTTTCGNGVKEPGETCDPLSSCPTACNDGQACTTDTLANAGTCEAQCTYTQITQCKGGDGCCAPGCNSTNDSDCQPVSLCGNGKIDPGETCDGNCPVSCADTDACTQDVMSGSAANCNVTCTHNPITTCTAPTGDSCCATGCNANNDVDCQPSCGNGVKESGETCDGADCPTSCDDNDPCTTDSLTGSAATCDAVCSHTPVTTGACVCGNGKLDPGETCDGNCPTPTSCDDGNACTDDVITGSAATCDAVCTHNPNPNAAGCVQCGNGRVDPGETCDGNCPTSCSSTDKCNPSVLTGSADTCSATCVAQPVNSCTNGDGCCPSDPTLGCTSTNDNDCSAPPDACTTCETTTHDGNRNCPDSYARCSGLAGVTSATSPMPGVPKAQLCQEIVQCMHTNHCAQIASTDCLCGANADPNACFSGTFAAAGGPCKDLIAAGGESNLMTDLANRFTDPTYAIGAADAVIETCDQFYCIDQCL